MKAWKVSDKNAECGTAIVFAETAGKAKQLCMYDDTFDDCEWTDLRVNRFKDYDQYYEGKEKVDWNDEEHRIRLVRDFGWFCFEPTISYCEACPAKQWCCVGGRRLWEQY
ncbi:MAG: hypothetical protein K5894_08320 [Lachnospiraceae bacterium]|nr:hypothetical protein [Lachnospiraceae bacterium]